MNRRIPSLLSLSVLIASAACDPGTEVSASLALPSEPSRVSVTPGIDLSGLASPEFRERIVIEHIALNIEDLRLLGADPRIPAGGLDLLDGARVIAADGRGRAPLQVAFPPHFASGDELAVYLRVAPSAELEGASVEIFGRLYATAPASGAARLSSVDPDVDPIHEDEDEAVDPDVDPIHDPDDPGGAVDPDVDPIHDPDNPDRLDDTEEEDDDVDSDPAPYAFSRRPQVHRAESDAQSVPFVLRDDEAADMVATLGARAHLDVVIGIPAARWLNPDVVASLESALNAVIVDRVDLTRWGSTHAGVSVDDRGLLEIRRSEDPLMSSETPDQLNETSGRPYFLTSGERVERNRLDR